MIRRSVSFCCAAAIMLGLFSFAHGQAIATFDESTPALLTGVYADPGAVTYTADSILFDVTAGGSSFGGVAGTVNFPDIDFNPSEFQWEARFRLLANNNVPGFGAVYSDIDPGFFIDEAWVFHFDTTGFTPADDWVVLRQGFNNPAVVGTSDGVQNPDLVLIGLVGASADNARLHLELDYLQIIPIPEPASLILLGFGAVILCSTSRRRPKRCNAG